MKLFFSSLICGAAVLLAGCSGDEAAAPGFSYYRLAPNPPPLPVIELVPQNDKPQERAWRPGYWRYDGREFTWVSGSFLAKPIPTAVWSPDRWDRRQYGWAYVPGHWQ